MSLTGKSDLVVSTEFVNDGFWPDLLVADLIKRYRVPADIPDPVVPTALTLAVMRVNDSLADVKAAIIALGFASLDGYTTANSSPLGDSEQLVVSYEHAVYSRAKAGLIPQFVNAVRQSKVADKLLDASEESEQYWLDESQAMIADYHRKFMTNADSMPGNAGVHVALI